jgi:hypothetical protein
MKRRELIQRIRAAGAARAISSRLVRQGASHEFWELGGIRFAIPRHRDLNEWTAEAIMRDLEPILGEDWWRQ